MSKSGIKFEPDSPYDINNKLIILQDNCSSHYLKDNNARIKDTNIQTIKFPPCSPELNIIENFWAYLTKKV